jgi:catechol 2,3-dioxygenase-like lactoylglutathione lyase family enzyme
MKRGVAALALASCSAWAGTVEGLDHVVVAVNDLAAAVADYRALGFAIKPGRPHDNGIRNFHVKFSDGTEIELLTAPQSRDALTATYRQHLAEGDGPAFVALYAPHGRVPTGLPFVFLGSRNASPTDLPEHFAHPNGARSLIAVWLAAADTRSLSQALEGLGGRPIGGAVKFDQGEVVLLRQASHRPIVRAVVAVDDVGAARRYLRAMDIAVDDESEGSVVLPRALTHGLVVELRERR